MLISLWTLWLCGAIETFAQPMMWVWGGAIVFNIQWQIGKTTDWCSNGNQRLDPPMWKHLEHLALFTSWPKISNNKLIFLSDIIQIITLYWLVHLHCHQRLNCYFPLKILLLFNDTMMQTIQFIRKQGFAATLLFWHVMQ